MTNRERIIKTIAFETVDFVPHSFEFTVEMLEKMKKYTKNDNFLQDIGNHISSFSLSEPFIEVKSGFFRDEYGVIWDRTKDKDIGVITNKCIASPEDLNNYDFPAVNEDYIRSIMEQSVSLRDGNFHIVNLGFSLFERAWTLCGMENLLCYMITDPDFVHKLLGKICDRNLKIISIANEYEYDCFMFGDDWGQQRGLIIGVPHWREFIKPYLAKMYGAVKDTEHYIAQHSCGDLREIMDDVINLGLNIYQTFQPEIYGLDYAQKLRGRLTIWGAISTQLDLPYRTQEEMKVITKKTLEAFCQGGLIAAPTHAVPRDVPPENIMAVLSILR